MLAYLLTTALAAASLAFGLPQSGDPVDNGPMSGPYLPTGTGPGKCTQDFRRRGVEQVIFAYNRVEPGQTVEALQRLPLRDDCHTIFVVNGSPPFPVAIDRTTTFDFAVATRQATSRVTGQYTSFHNNTATTSGTELVRTNITTGVLHSIALPVTIHADVYFDYDDSCLIYDITAYATAPSDVAGMPIEPPIADQILALSPLNKRSAHKRQT